MTNPNERLQHHVSGAIERGEAEPIAAIAPMTRKAFLHTYRQLLSEIEWAKKDPARLDRFMQTVERTLRTGSVQWDWNTPLSREAWKKIGCKGRMTLRGLLTMAVE